jgi:hypothetical protein
MTYKVGDIIKDVSDGFQDLNLYGIIVDIVTVFDQLVFHVKYFDNMESGDITPLRLDEIEKVS